MKYINEYKSKLITPEQVGRLVKPGDTVDLYGYYTAGEVLDREMSKRADELTNVKVRNVNKRGTKWRFLEVDNECRSFIHTPIYKGGYDNSQILYTNQAPIPALFYEYPLMYRKGDLIVDVGSRQVSPMDEEGFFSFGGSPSYAKAMADASKIFVAEINTNIHPTKCGHTDSKIHISEVDYIVEGESPPLGETPDPIPTEADVMIAKYIVNELRDGSCIQIGYGKIPMAVTSFIASSDLKDLGVHSEMLCDSLMNLYKAGLVTGKRKNIDKGKIVFGIASGSKELQDFIVQCEDVYPAPVDYVNDVNIIGKNDNFISINACVELDVTGQINSETIGPRQISGTGGQLDFVMGSYRSNNGKSIIACSSTLKKKDGTMASKILPTLTPGSAVSDPRASVHYVCTEYGIVNLKGATLWDRVERIVSIAHPDFREQLLKDAEKMGIWRKSNKR